MTGTWIFSNRVAGSAIKITTQRGSGWAGRSELPKKVVFEDWDWAQDGSCPTIVLKNLAETHWKSYPQVFLNVFELYSWSFVLHVRELLLGPLRGLQNSWHTSFNRFKVDEMAHSPKKLCAISVSKVANPSDLCHFHSFNHGSNTFRWRLCGEYYLVSTFFNKCILWVMQHLLSELWQLQVLPFSVCLETWYMKTQFAFG